MIDVTEQFSLAYKMLIAAELLDKVSLRYAYPHSDMPTPETVEWSASELRAESARLVALAGQQVVAE